MTIFSPQQDAALKAVDAWLKAKPGRNGTPQVFRLFGYAGTGKTTLAQHIAEAVDGEVKFAAFTGKAAAVMRGKGCHSASTIHSLIYRARQSGEEIPSFDLYDEAPAQPLPRITCAALPVKAANSTLPSTPCAMCLASVVLPVPA